MLAHGFRDWASQDLVALSAVGFMELHKIVEI